MDKKSNTLQILTKLLKESDSTIARLENSLKNAPEGRINAKTLQGKRRFFKVDNNGVTVYLGEDKDKEIKALIQKKLDQELLKVSLTEKKALEKAITLMGTKTRAQVWEEFPKHYKEYVKVDESVDVGYIQKWQKQYGLTPKDDKHLFLSSKGDYVRSKSEYIIAECLNKAQIPYHYEVPLILEHGLFRFSPDFWVLNPRTLKTYFWEHFGMMDDKNYFTKTKSKLDLYAEYGIFPGKNLILTLESKEEPLLVEQVCRLIKEYLL